MTTTTSTAAITATMKTLRFGIEVETVGVDTRPLATAIASAFGWIVRQTSAGWGAVMPDGRVWDCQHDGSLPSVSAEIVSPILTYTDIELLQNVVRVARATGARESEATGIHVHIGAEALDYAAAVRLARIVHAHEEILFVALGVQQHRRDRYCRPVPTRFIVEAQNATNRATLSSAWYGGQSSRGRYDSTRYHGLNLNSYFFRDTVEFRYFEGTMHAGKVKAYVQLCMSLVAFSQNASRVAPKVKPLDPVTVKYRMRDLVTRLGLNGDEFKTARHHLYDHLEGTSSNPARAHARNRRGDD